MQLRKIRPTHLVASFWLPLHTLPERTSHRIPAPCPLVFKETQWDFLEMSQVFRMTYSLQNVTLFWLSRFQLRLIFVSHRYFSTVPSSPNVGFHHLLVKWRRVQPRKKRWDQHTTNSAAKIYNALAISFEKCSFPLVLLSSFTAFSLTSTSLSKAHFTWKLDYHSETFLAITFFSDIRLH